MNETPNANRIASGGAGLAAAIIIAWVLTEFFGVNVPPEVSAAGGALITTGVNAAYSLLPGFGYGR